MKLNEALKAVAAARAWPVGQHILLACGFEPLHLPAFLQAHYQARFAGEALRVSTGLFGDLEGNVLRAAGSDAGAAAVLIEWNDLDTRLGARSSGPWSAEDEILADVGGRLGRLQAGIAGLADRMPVVVAGPGIRFALAGSTAGWQISRFELGLDDRVAGFLADVAGLAGVRVLHPHRLAELSPPAARRDLRMELAAGFPLRTDHASVLAGAVIELAFPPPVKKGLITDLDDTLWSGIAGEVGPDAVSWGQADHAQLHALYQSMLRQLHESGVLLAVVSKNEVDVVDAALARRDLLVPGAAFFPVRVGWGPKSASVSAVLGAWNLGAGDVVLVDDSAMELEEVRAVHPDLTCVQFPDRDPDRSLAVLERLRDLFGKPAVTGDDRLRSASVRAMASFAEEKVGRDLGEFLRGLDGRLVFDRSRDGTNRRLLELINKTNQFNLNGVRVGEAEWLDLLGRDDGFVAGVAYTDRLGALGTVGVVAGRIGDTVEVAHWVLSCRAFSRRIEHHMLLDLFESLGRDELRLDYRPTERNRPFQELVRQLGGAPEAGAFVVSRARVEELLRALPHEVTESAR
jgi:FkbH-like protein